ncbi:MAG: S-methyl-5-thioribose-1-phosphate isomerase [Methanobacteriota archaeon]|nr:MAG: S-methyl-5-thioribose-1-phosphate isomerase [Euryarchaeota archaeon]
MRVKTRDGVKEYRTVWMEQNVVRMIDQRQLPHSFHVLSLGTCWETSQAIRDMAVRGAGAIGASAAYALAQAVLGYRGEEKLEKLVKHIKNVYKTVLSTRPTAIDLKHGLDHVLGSVEAARTVEEARNIARRAAESFAEDNAEQGRMIGVHGEKLVSEGATILTHCNAGALAFVDWGSALSPLRIAKRKGKNFKVLVDETRPWLQGARLTSWELLQEDIPHEIIVDSAAGYFMQRGDVDMVIVGADRVIAKTGDVANKIGTYTLAVLAHENKIPFYVAIPTTTIDWQTEKIPIEERDPREVLHIRGKVDGTISEVSVAPEDANAKNPVFDITPGRYITGFITPKGVYKPGELEKLKPNR